MADLPTLDLESDEFVKDPIGVFDRLRKSAWAAQSERGLEVFSYAGVEAAYQNAGIVAGVMELLRRMGLDPDTMAGGGGNMQGTEGPDHTRYRRVVSRWFTPRRVDELRPRVEALVESLVAPVSEAGGGEVMSEIAVRVPGQVFCWMIGAPESEGDRVYRLSGLLIEAFEGDFSRVDEIFGAAVEMGEFVEELIAEKRKQPGDDLLSIMLGAVDAGDIKVEDAHSLSFELLAASTDNTAHSAGLALSLLAARPDQWQLLRRSPDLVPGAIEECLRVEPRVRVDTGFSPDGTTLLDVDVPAGTMVYEHIAAAHMDPAVYPNPGEFDITRQPGRPQLNFGTGRHFCLGAALARMELAAMVGTCVQRWESLGLAAEPRFTRRLSTGVDELRVTCEPAV